MATCGICRRHWNTLPGEEQDHPCPNGCYQPTRSTITVHYELYRDDDSEVRREDDDEVFEGGADILPPGCGQATLLIDVDVVPDEPAPRFYRARTPEYGPPELILKGMRLEREHNVNGMDAMVESPVCDVEAEVVYGAYRNEIDAMVMEEA